MYRYLKLLDNNTIIRRKINSPKFERYDVKSKTWIPDWELSEIFTGDVRTITLTEKEAQKELNI